MTTMRVNVPQELAYRLWCWAGAGTCLSRPQLLQDVIFLVGHHLGHLILGNLPLIAHQSHLLRLKRRKNRPGSVRIPRLKGKWRILSTFPHPFGRIPIHPRSKSDAGLRQHLLHTDNTSATQFLGSRLCIEYPGLNRGSPPFTQGVASQLLRMRALLQIHSHKSS